MLEKIPEEDSIGVLKLQRILGQTWNPESDQLLFAKPKLSYERENITQRKLLSMAASLFDSIGIISPLNSTGMHLAKSRQTRTQLGPATIKGTLRRNSAMDGGLPEYAFNSNPQMSSSQRRWNSRVAHLHRRFTFSNISSTDRTAELSWIKSKDRQKMYIANRLKKIAENSNKDDWRHVPGKMNPADHGTRGLAPCDLQKFMDNSTFFPDQT